MLRERTAVAIAATAMSLILSAAASAATFTVNTQQDKAFVPAACAGATGDCALRQALHLARSGGTIVLPAGRYTIDHALVTEEGDGDHDLDIGGGVSCPCTAVVIEGAGARTTIVDGGGTDRVFDVYDGFLATISGVTVTGGSAPSYGGGIRTGGDTTIINSTIKGNTAVDSGGGIHNEADGSGAATTLINSTVTGNTAPGGGQVAPAGGGIYNGRGTVTVINSTISGNTAGTPARSAARGGGIASNVSAGGSEGVVLRNATVHANSAQATSSSGGNISTTGFGSVAGTVRAANSIITGGSASTAANCEGAAQQSLGFNFLGDADCGPNGTSDSVGTDPKLSALGDAGGPTDTLRPTPLSPVLEAGDPAGCKDPAGTALATDQRGVTRPLGRCDIGAVELAPPTATAGETSSITQTSATIGGRAGNPFILAGSAFVEFGTTTSYTRSFRATAPALTLPAGASAFAVNATIDKLTPDTLYHYRVVAINGDGTATAPDATFRTLPTPVVVPPPPKCASRRNFKIRLPQIPKRYRAKVVSAKVTLGSKTLAVVKGGRLRSQINLKNLPKGRFTLKISMKLTRGLKAVQVRRYKTCTLKLAHVPDPPKVSRA